MNGTLGPITGPFILIGAVMVFLILFTTIRRVVTQMPLFAGGPHTLVAFCIAVLATLGMAPGASHAILVPYGALGLAILLMMLLGLAEKGRRRLDCRGGQEGQEPRQLRKPDDRKVY
jgi:hypothetical protein